MGSPVDVKVWREHWQDEGDAAYLYQSLAAIEPDQTRAEVHRRLAEVEERHVKLCGDILKEQGETLPPFRPSLRAKSLAWLGRTFGPEFLLSILLAEEGRELKGYLQAYKEAPIHGPKGTIGTLARETAEHAETLGAARSFFTGRGIIRSGMDMFLVGLGVAIVAYFIGWLLTGHL